MSDSLPSQKKLVLISEAAKVLGVSIDTVRRWDKSGVLHSERANGKNRYFSLDELEQHKLNQPLSISEAAQELGVSPVTLRRLESRGSLKPERNSAGERVYSKDSIKNFSNGNYILRKQQIEIEEEIPEPLQEEPTIPYASLKPHSKINEFLAGFTILFVILVTFSIRNIWIAEFRATKPLIDNTPVVLSTTQEAKSEISTPETKSKVVIKSEDGQSNINIRQEPSIKAQKIGKAADGDTFEIISFNSGWFEVKLASDSAGFISAEYVEEEN